MREVCSASRRRIETRQLTAPGKTSGKSPGIVGCRGFSLSDSVCLTGLPEGSPGSQSPGRSPGCLRRSFRGLNAEARLFLLGEGALSAAHHRPPRPVSLAPCFCPAFAFSLALSSPGKARPPTSPGPPRRRMRRRAEQSGGQPEGPSAGRAAEQAPKIMERGGICLAVG